MLPPPEVKVSAGVYRYAWVQDALTVRLDHLREDSKGVLTGEITLRVSGSHIHQARLNLTSTTSRAALVRYCESKGAFDWASIVEYACVLTLQHWREGESAVVLKDLPMNERVKWRLSPILLEQQANLLFGPGGSGKSYLALYFGVLISIPWKMHHWEPEPGQVLYLDYETSQEEVLDRAQAIYKGLERPWDSRILYRRCSTPLVDDIEQVQRIVAESEIEFVIVDSAAYAVGGEPESAAVTTAYYNALRSLKVTTLTLAHVAKDKEKKGAFGSVFWQNGARSAWELVSSQEEGEENPKIGLYHRKMNSGKRQHPIGLQLFFQDSSVSFKETDPRDDAELSKKVALPYRISGILAHGSRTLADLVGELGPPTKENSVVQALGRRKDLFVKLPNGEWGILSQG